MSIVKSAPETIVRPTEKTGSVGTSGPGIQRSSISLLIFLMCAAMLYPLIELVIKSLQRQTSITRSVWSFDSYRQLFEGAMLKSMMVTFGIAVASTIIATTVGTTLAWIVARTNVPGRRIFQLANYIPFFFTPMIGAIAWSYLASPQTGLLNRLATGLHLATGPVFNIYTATGIVFVLSLYMVPLVILLCTGSFSQMDAVLEDASRLCGAGTIRTNLRITWPLVAPAVLSAAVLTFVLAVDELGVPLVIGYPYGIQTLSTHLYDSVTQSFPPNYNFASAIGCFMIVVSAVCILVQRRLVAHRSFTTVTGRSQGARRIDLGRARWLAFGANSVYVMLSVVLPLFVLVIAAFSRVWTGTISLSQLTGSNWSFVFKHDPLAMLGLKNSLILATGAATIVMVLGLISTYGIDRLKIRGGRWMDMIMTIPIGVPALAVAVGLLSGLIRTPLYGTLAIIGLAYGIRFFPYGQRTLSAAMGAIHSDLEDASSISGSGRIGTLRRIVLPLVRPAFVNGWLLLFIMFMREVSISNILWVNGTQPLAVALFNALDFEPPGVAAGLTLLQVGVILVPAIVLMKLSGQKSASEVMGLQGGQS